MDQKVVRVIQNVGFNGEIELSFYSDTLPMAIHFAESWAKRQGFKLVKSPAKIAALFPVYRVSTSRNEKIFYVKE